MNFRSAFIGVVSAFSETDGFLSRRLATGATTKTPGAIDEELGEEIQAQTSSASNQLDNALVEPPAAKVAEVDNLGKEINIGAQTSSASKRPNSALGHDEQQEPPAKATKVESGEEIQAPPSEKVTKIELDEEIKIKIIELVDECIEEEDLISLDKLDIETGIIIGIELGWTNGKFHCLSGESYEKYFSNSEIPYNLPGFGLDQERIITAIKKILEDNKPLAEKAAAEKAAAEKAAAEELRQVFIKVAESVLANSPPINPLFKVMVGDTLKKIINREVPEVEVFLKDPKEHEKFSKNPKDYEKNIRIRLETNNKDINKIFESFTNNPKYKTFIEDPKYKTFIEDPKYNTFIEVFESFLANNPKYKTFIEDPNYIQVIIKDMTKDWGHYPMYIQRFFEEFIKNWKTEKAAAEKAAEELRQVFIKVAESVLANSPPINPLFKVMVGDTLKKIINREVPEVEVFLKDPKEHENFSKNPEDYEKNKRIEIESNLTAHNKYINKIFERFLAKYPEYKTFIEDPKYKTFIEDPKYETFIEVFESFLAKYPKYKTFIEDPIEIERFFIDMSDVWGVYSKDVQRFFEEFIKNWKTAKAAAEEAAAEKAAAEELDEETAAKAAAEEAAAEKAAAEELDEEKDEYQ